MGKTLPFFHIYDWCCVCGWSDSRSVCFPCSSFPFQVLSWCLSACVFLRFILAELLYSSLSFSFFLLHLHGFPSPFIFLHCISRYKQSMSMDFFHWPPSSPCLPASIVLRSVFSPTSISPVRFFFSFLSSSIVCLLSLCAVSGSPAAVVLNWCCSASAFILHLSPTPPPPPHLSFSSSMLPLFCIPGRKKTGIRQTVSRLCTSSFPVCYSKCLCVCLWMLWVSRLFIFMLCVPVVMLPSLKLSPIVPAHVAVLCSTEREEHAPPCNFFTISQKPQLLWGKATV